MDMFEPQDHPNDLLYPGGPPRPPYDVTGYNLSYSMGIEFDRILDALDGPFEPLADVVTPPRGRLPPAAPTGAYLLRHDTNDAFIAINRLLRAGQAVGWAKASFSASGRDYPAGTTIVTANSATGPLVERLAAEKGLSFDSIAVRPAVEMAPLRPVRVGLWDQYGGSIPSGWTRWLLEQFEFPFEVVYPQTLDAGNLASRFDVLVFVDGAIPASDSAQRGQPAAEQIPVEYRDRLGAVTVAKTVPALRAFVQDGGTLLAIGSSTSIAGHLGLPVQDALIEGGAPLPDAKFYVPGALLEARVDTSAPLAYGMRDHAYLFFDESRAFRLAPDALARGARTIAWYDGPAPLRSGWAWGQSYLNQAAAIVEVPLGRGRVVLFGSEIIWRAQPHGTFKFLFNGIYGAVAR
jgi:hypothetical protein